MGAMDCFRPYSKEDVRMVLELGLIAKAEWYVAIKEGVSIKETLPLGIRAARTMKEWEEMAKEACRWGWFPPNYWWSQNEEWQ